MDDESNRRIRLALRDIKEAEDRLRSTIEGTNYSENKVVTLGYLAGTAYRLETALKLVKEIQTVYSGFDL